MRSISVLSVVMVLTLMLLGCSSASLRLLPAMNNLPESVTHQQFINLISWDNTDDERMLAVLELEKDKVSLAGLTLNGIGLFNLQVADGVPSVDAGLRPPVGVSAERMLDDLLMIYLPLAHLQQQLPQSWKVTETRSGTERSRRLFNGHVVILEIHYNTDVGGEYKVQHHPIGKSVLSGYKVTLLEVSNI